MKKRVLASASAILVLGLFAFGCEISVDYPETDATIEPTLCETDSDCSQGVCDPVSGTCVDCLADKDCPAGKFCNEAINQCVTCFEDSQCKTGVCDEELGICIECSADADCASGICDAAEGVCIECGSNADCKTANACMVGVCVDGSCSYGEMPDGTLCDDADPCTAGDACVAGLCAPGPMIEGCMPPVGQCFDADGKQMPDGAMCDDGDPCTLDDYCLGGKCVGDVVAADCVEKDLDGDGFSVATGDCDDLDASVNPGAIELCDGRDNDCDGQVDEQCSSECVVGGCSGELCGPAGAPLISDCMWAPEYECVKYSECGPYGPGGSCGWANTPEYLECLGQVNPICSSDSDCDDGYFCLEGFCQPKEIYPCSSNADCGPMQVCKEGICVNNGGQCKDLGGIDLGACEMVVGVGLVNGQCIFLSGCGCGDYCDYIFESAEECQEACGQQIPCVTDADCGPMFYCMAGVCVQNGVLCQDLAGVDFGFCDMVVGVGIVNGQCAGISGCGCGAYCDSIFNTLQECQENCAQVVKPCMSSADCDAGYVCMNGVCVQDGELCMDVAGIDFGDCKMSIGVAVFNGVCQSVGGCNCEPLCGAFFNSIDECKKTCFGTCTPKPEVCNGIDDDCDGMVDEGLNCGTCDDNNPCTKDDLGPDGACQHTLIVCDDNDPCTADMCDPQTGACYSLEVPGCLPGECASDADCPAGQFCMEGMCQANTSCWSNSQCPANHYCFFPDCAVETGSCTLQPEACPLTYEPVCGCNGITYGNLCLLMNAKQSLAYKGTCI